MVNLIRGRRGFSCKLALEADIARYNHDGGKFFMVSEDKIGVHEAEDAKVVCEMEASKRVLCVAVGEVKRFRLFGLLLNFFLIEHAIIH